MDELFHALLQDVYFAEKQLLKALPKLAKKSTNGKLQEAFTTHRDETEGHVERLEKVFEAIGKKPRGKTCDAILGIIAEGEQVIDKVDDEAVRDAGILAAAQAADTMRSRAMERCARGRSSSASKRRWASSAKRWRRKSTPINS
jgi:ferritin-like metal-binding protein YciE